MTRGDGSIYRRGKRWWISYYAPDAETGRRREHLTMGVLAQLIDVRG